MITDESITRYLLIDETDPEDMGVIFEVRRVEPREPGERLGVRLPGLGPVREPKSFVRAEVVEQVAAALRGLRRADGDARETCPDHGYFVPDPLAPNNGGCLKCHAGDAGAVPEPIDAGEQPEDERTA